jgi:hypothetical protein
MHWSRWRKYGVTEKPLPNCPKGHRVTGGQCAICAEAKASQREICTVDGCECKVLARGWCRLHYLRWWRHADPAELEKPPQDPRVCSLDGCDGKHVARSWCDKHYSRWLKTGTTDAPPERPAECSIADCGRPVVGFGWCKRHWSQLTGKAAEYQLRRKALKLGSQVGRVNLRAILAEFGRVCHICGGNIGIDGDLHFDHVIPLSRGGAHAQENIRPAHKLCNLRKGTRLMSELLAAERG